MTIRPGQLHAYVPPTPPSRVERILWAVALAAGAVGLWGGLGWIVWRWVR